MYADPRTEWRIADIERKASRAEEGLYRVDALSRDLGSVERSNRELRAEVDGLRNEIAGYQERFDRLENRLNEIQPQIS